MVASGNGHASLIGATLGHYAVQSLLGRGAVGTVYLARDTLLGRPVALKVLLGSLARNPDQVRRFQREAKAAAPLQHPNIVSIYEAGMRDGTPYIAMEYVEGESLERFLRRKGADLPWQHALHVTEQVALALDCAHQAGIIHRDVKPANILLDRHGQVRLTDFGIASSIQGEAKWGQTELGRLLGTPEYMSPEQCIGEKDLTPASDLFSLGVMLYRMLSGRLPFDGHSAVALMKSITTETPPRLAQLVSGLPDDVARLVAHLLEKDPKHRPASAHAVIEIVQRLQRENGGASALPEALNRFAREQMKTRPAKAGTPASPKKTPHGPKITAPGPRRMFQPIGVAAKLSAAILIIAALTGAGYWRFNHAEHRMPGAPVLPDIGFAQEGNGIVLAPLPSPAWSVTELHWAGDSPALLVQVEGPSGSTLEGARGVLSANPERQILCSVRTPSSPILDPEHWRMDLTGGQLGMLPPAPEGTPLCGALLLQGNVGPRQPAAHGYRLVGQRWDAAAPLLRPLFDATQCLWPPDQGAPWESTEKGDAAPKPGGLAVCMLLDTEGPGGNYLAEFDLRSQKNSQCGPRLTSPGAPILPGTIQYSPDGARIAYMRRKNAQEQELWVVAADAREIDGKPLAVGRFEGRAVFSPEGDRLAVAQGGPEGARLLLLRIGDGEIEAEPGPGRIIAESWHPSGQYLVVAAPGPDSAAEQLWAVETDAPYRRRVITRFAQGVRIPGAVARDGRWAATVTRSDRGETLVFVNLNAVLFNA